MTPQAIIAEELTTDVRSLIELRDRYWQWAFQDTWRHRTIQQEETHFCVTVVPYIRFTTACQQLIDRWADYSI